MMHWTKDCWKWKKDGTREPTFKSQKEFGCGSGKPAKMNWKKNFLQLSKRIGNLKKRVNRRKRKHEAVDSDSSNET